MSEFLMDRRTFLAGTAALAAASALTGAAALPGPAFAAENRPGEPVALPPLPWKENALEPYISAQTLSFHHGKHHAAYVEKTLKAVQGTPLQGQPLSAILLHAATDPAGLALFQNAAQAWNHNFLWKSMKPGGGGKPPADGALSQGINAAFGSFETFAQKFTEAAVNQFGSGWAWLAADAGGLSVYATSNADNPLTRKQTPLLVLDVWEHAYYLDYQNRRADYVKAFLDHLANWDFAAQNLAEG